LVPSGAAPLSICFSFADVCPHCRSKRRHHSSPLPVHFRAYNKTEMNAAKAKELRKKLRNTEGERRYGALAEGAVGDTATFRRSLNQIKAPGTKRCG
jgi:hypothetical protein